MTGGGSRRGTTTAPLLLSAGVGWVERGIGLRLLERGLAAQAGVGADLHFEPEGLRCTLRLPQPRIGSPAKGAWGHPAPARRRGRPPG